MKIRRLFSFLFTSISTGLAAAFIVVLVRPDLLNPQSQSSDMASSTRTSAVTSYADAVRNATPAVVNIYATKLTLEKPAPVIDDPVFQHFFGRGEQRPRQRRENSLGSGVVIDKNGIILTNHHVVAGASKINIVTGDGEVRSARIVGSDPDTDLAVLQTGGEELPVAEIGRSEELQVGDVVLAIGNPFGVGKTVTQGIVSAVGRHHLRLANYEDFIQTDAAINQGNSGGALVNSRGQVIGINAAILSRDGGSNGIGFAIPISMATQVKDQIMLHGRVIRGWIGLSGQDLTPSLAESLNIEFEQGVLVSGVLEDGPADLAGMLPGDVITAINDEPILVIRDILNRVAQIPPGEKIILSIVSDSIQRDISIQVAERPVNVGQ